MGQGGLTLYCIPERLGCLEYMGKNSKNDSLNSLRPLRLWFRGLSLFNRAGAACIFVVGWQLLDTQRSHTAVLLPQELGEQRSLGLKVLAEGVETVEQLAVLRLCQCDAIQGWLMHPALPPAECEKLLRAAA